MLSSSKAKLIEEQLYKYYVELASLQSYNNNKFNPNKIKDKIGTIINKVNKLFI